jgi:uncharacterized protein (TIGR02679 family)
VIASSWSRVDVAGVSDGLTAYTLVAHDRRGRERFDSVALRGRPPASQDLLGVAAGALHAAGVRLLRPDAPAHDRAVVWALAKTTRSRSVIERHLGTAAGEALARAGIVELIATVDGTTITRWTRWRRTTVGERAHAQMTAHRNETTIRRDAALSAAAQSQVKTPAAKWLSGGSAADALVARYGSSDIQAQAQAAESLARIAQALPADGISLPIFARNCLNATHALDPGTKIGAIAARMAALISGDVEAADQVASGGAEAFRTAWEAAGVVPDDLACAVAVWNLPCRDTAHPAAAQAAAGRSHNQPSWVTLWALRGDASWVAAPPLPRERPGWVFVCEGTALIREAAVRHLNTPLIRTGGVPNVAAILLLKALISAGWRVAVGCDVEPRPLAATVGLLSRLGNAATPWRLFAHDMNGAATSGERFTAENVPDIPWDPALTQLLRSDPRRRTEEDRVEILLMDLARGQPGSAPVKG